MNYPGKVVGKYCRVCANFCHATTLSKLFTHVEMLQETLDKLPHQGFYPLKTKVPFPLPQVLTCCFTSVLSTLPVPFCLEMTP